MSVGDEGLPAWGRDFPDGNFVQLDQALPTERGSEEQANCVVKLIV